MNTKTLYFPFLVFSFLSASAPAADYRVVTAPSAKPWERTAAAELETYLARLSENGRLTVEGKDGVVFHVGDDAALKEEEWTIRSEGSDVYLAGGGMRGTLYAVYHFLEDECSVRWWNDEDEDVPAAKPLEFGKLERRGKPYFIYREFYRDGSSDPRTAARCRVNSNGDRDMPMELGGGFEFGSPYHTHTWDRNLPFAEYGKEHPEWYSLRDGKRVGGQTAGQLCLTCPGLVDVMAETIVANIEKDRERSRTTGCPVPSVYDLTMNDNKNFCQCPACSAETEKYGHSGRQLRFVNAVARKVGAKYPELLFKTTAYEYSEPAPKGGVVSEANVLVMLANTRKNMGRSIHHPDNRFMHDLVEEWSRVARRLFISEYAITYVKSTYDFPFPSEDILADSFPYYADHGVRGMLMEHERPATADMFELKFYLERRLMEDPYLDARALTDEFYVRYFGVAAGPVRKARGHLRKIFDERKVNLPWFPDPVAFFWIHQEDIELAAKLFDEAEALAKGDAKLLRRVRKARSSLDRIAASRKAAVTYRPPLEGVTKNEYLEFPVDRTWVLYQNSDAEFVMGAGANGALAVRLPAHDTRGYRFPFPYGLAAPKLKKSVKAVDIKEPLGEGWQWYRLEGVKMPETGTYVYFTWFVQMQVGTPEMVGHTYDILLHARHDGSAFFIDRILFEAER